MFTLKYFLHLELFCPANAPLQLRALSVKEASRQLQAVVSQPVIEFLSTSFGCDPTIQVLAFPLTALALAE